MKNNLPSALIESGSDHSNLVTCPCCHSEDVKWFHHQKNVPVNSVLTILSKSEAIQFPRGNISLCFCRKCGFIHNTEFDPESVRYSSECEESQGYSPTFNSFAESIATELIQKYNLFHKTIIEIGCGKGEFLELMVNLGQNKGIGFDPAYVHGRGDQTLSDQITFIQDYYTEKYVKYFGDMICCRMTLEHIFNPAELVNVVRRSIGDREAVVFFQVPNMTRIIKNFAFEDIYYEHCSYFSAGSLARLFRKSHFDLLNLREVYKDQYILIEAKPSRQETDTFFPLENDLHLLEKYVNRFKAFYPKALKYWQYEIDKLIKAGKRVVVWGAGSKGVAFLTTLPNSNYIEYVVDINPYRQGTYMAGTGQKIMEPKFLQAYQPDVVIIMNTIYLEEIQNELQEMELEPKIIGLERIFYEKAELE